MSPAGKRYRLQHRYRACRFQHYKLSTWWLQASRNMFLVHMRHRCHFPKLKKFPDYNWCTLSHPEPNRFLDYSCHRC